MAISTITYAGSLIELVKSATVPCEGCYFAVFDKVQKDYKLTYITPNTPDMATIVKNKQEVLWVMQMVIIHHIGIGVKIIKKMIIKQASNLGYVKVDLVLKLNMNVLAFLVEYSYKGCSVFTWNISCPFNSIFATYRNYAYNVKINKS
jgi:hypothetical protein